MFKTIIIITLFATITFANPVQEYSGTGWKVVGGSNAAPGQFPFILSLRLRSGSHICGGSILTETWAITAAHCVDGMSASSLMVVVGSNQLNATDSTKVLVSQSTTHPDWNPSTIENDLALLKLAEPLKLTNLVQAIQLEETYVDNSRNCTLVGWGRTAISAPIPNDLQYLNSKTVDVSFCKSMWNRISPVFETQICTLTHTGEGACYGDSGGPLVVENNGQFKLIALVSWGSPCAKGMPDVFTRVASYYTWINSIIKN